MKTLTERIALEYGIEKNSDLVISDVRKDINYYETLCKICADENIDLSNISDADFEDAVQKIENFCNSANTETGYAVSITIESNTIKNI